MERINLDELCLDCNNLNRNGGDCHGEPYGMKVCSWYTHKEKKEKKENNMPGGISLLEFITKASEQKITKNEFGRIMHDPNATEEEIQQALDALAACDGYENLAD